MAESQSAAADNPSAAEEQADRACVGGVTNDNALGGILRRHCGYPPESGEAWDWFGQPCSIGSASGDTVVWMAGRRRIIIFVLACLYSGMLHMLRICHMYVYQTQIIYLCCCVFQRP